MGKFTLSINLFNTLYKANIKKMAHTGYLYDDIVGYLSTLQKKSQKAKTQNETK